MKKRILAIVLTGVLLLGTVPAMAAKVLPYGDVDDSGVIDAEDALRILQYSVEKITFTPEQAVAAEVSGDGTVNAQDALQVLQYAVEYIDGFPAEANAPRIEISEENFPDKTFRTLVRRMVHRDYMTLAEISKVTTLDARGFEIVDGIKYPLTAITDLTGIEYFTQLEELDCSFNTLTTLDLSKNTALKKLNCSYNQIDQMDVSANPALEEMYCDGNPIASLDVSKNNVLVLLGIEETQITQVNLENNPTLQFVWHDEADLGSWQPAVKIDETNFPDPVFREDVKGVDTDQNGILSAEEIGAVTRFNFYPKDLHGYPFRKLIADAKGIEFFISLEYVNFVRNLLTEINLDRNTRLKSLQIQTNDLRYLNVSRNVVLEYLQIDENLYLYELDISKNTELKQVSCEKTNLQVLDIRNNLKLEELKADSTMEVIS